MPRKRIPSNLLLWFFIRRLTVTWTPHLYHKINLTKNPSNILLSTITIPLPNDPIFFFSILDIDHIFPLYKITIFIRYTFYKFSKWFFLHSPASNLPSKFIHVKVRNASFDLEFNSTSSLRFIACHVGRRYNQFHSRNKLNFTAYKWTVVK